MVEALDAVKAVGANWVAIHPYAGIRKDGTVRVRREREPRRRDVDRHRDELRFKAAVHGEVAAPAPLRDGHFTVGSRVRVLPNHACMTAAMYDRYHVVDGPGREIVDVWDGDAILMAQKLAAELGIAVGISSGANFLGALKIQNELGPDATVVTVFPDDNKKYLSTDLLRDEPGD